MELSSPKLKKLLYFSKKKFFLVSREMELSSPKLKKLLYFSKKSFSYVS